MLPVIIILGVMVDYGSAYFARTIDTINNQMQKNKSWANKWAPKISKTLTRKRIYAIFVFVCLFAIFLDLPIFLTPWQGISDQNYYQIMNNAGYQAIQWSKQNTPANSVFVSDATYGWWLGGFAQRPTISAVSPQFLTVARELNPAQNASLLLDTDYMIDNGYIQVREDGGYIGRHNPQFLADLSGTPFPYAFCQFNNSEITLLSNSAGSMQTTDLTQIPVTSMQIVGEQTNSPTIIVNRENSDFNYSEILKVTSGVAFANMTITIQSINQNVLLDWANYTLNSDGKFLEPGGNTVAMLDTGMNEVGQLFFVQNQPEISCVNTQNPCITQLCYNLQGKSSAEIQVLVEIYPVSKNDIENQSNLNSTLLTNAQNPQKPVASRPITTFNYQATLQEYSVSYIANLDFEVNSKFTNDPAFTLAYFNTQVAIFKVKASG
jgi:hypothetical protein